MPNPKYKPTGKKKKTYYEGTDLRIVCHLQKLLDERGISRRNFAEQINVRPMLINDLCTNDLVQLPFELIALLCDALDIRDLNQLFEVVTVHELRRMDITRKDYTRVIYRKIGAYKANGATNTEEMSKELIKMARANVIDSTEEIDEYLEKHAKFEEEEPTEESTKESKVSK